MTLKNTKNGVSMINTLFFCVMHVWNKTMHFLFEEKALRGLFMVIGVEKLFIDY